VCFGTAEQLRRRVARAVERNGKADLRQRPVLAQALVEKNGPLPSACCRPAALRSVAQTRADVPPAERTSPGRRNRPHPGRAATAGVRAQTAGRAASGPRARPARGSAQTRPAQTPAQPFSLIQRHHPPFAGFRPAQDRRDACATLPPVTLHRWVSTPRPGGSPPPG